MSEEENEALMRRFWEEVFNKGNLKVIDELVHPDCINHGAPSGPTTGIDAIKQLVPMIRDAFPDAHLAIEDMIAKGDRVITRTTYSGTHRGTYQGIAPTGRQFTQTQIHIAKWVDGKMLEHWANRDDLGLMQQLGAIAAPGTGA